MEIKKNWTYFRMRESKKNNLNKLIIKVVIMYKY